MSLRDEQSISAQTIEAEDANDNVAVEDMQAILKLVAMQLESADHRDAQALGDMYERLQAICNDARLTEGEVPVEFASALERLQAGIRQLAQLTVGDEAAAEAVDQPVADEAVEPTIDEVVQSEGQEPSSVSCAEEEPVVDGTEAPDVFNTSLEAAPNQNNTGLVSDLFPAPEDDFGRGEVPAEEVGEMAMTDGIFTDNAADQVEHAYHDQQEKSCEPPPILAMSEYPAAANANAEPANQDTSEPQAAESIAGDLEQPWDQEAAEALTRLYETDEAGFAMHSRLVPRMLPGMPPDESEFEMMAITPRMDRGGPMAQEPAAQTEEQPQEPQCPELQADPGAAEECCASKTIQPIDQAWLEERFAEIADKVEEAMLALRDDDALEDLSNRFGEFEQRIGDALEGVATRQDIDALKVAETQIDSMLGYFDRVEAKFSRIDAMEGQLQTIIERISDDQLAQHFSNWRESAQADYAELAETVAQTVAQRFLADNDGQSEGAAISEIRESLEAFMDERRKHDAESASMLDTVQQALISVLDRVEAMEVGQPGASEMASVRFEASDVSHEDMSHVIGSDSYKEQDAIEGKQPEAADEPAVSESFHDQLEYPASMMGLSGSDEADHQQSASESDNAVDHNTLPQPVENDAGPAFDDLAVAQADLAADMEPASAEFVPATGEGELPSASPIDRLRQEFIANAKRARQNVAEQAAKGEQDKPKRASLTSKLSIPKLPNLGISFGMSKSETQPEETWTEASQRAPVTGEEAETQTSRFALSRSKILVGAIIVLFATAGALLMMRGKPKTDVTTPPAQIEQPFEDRAAGSELFEPTQSVPGKGGQQGNLDGGRVYDGEFNYDIAPGLTGKPLAAAPAGFALTDLDRQPSLEEISKARHQQAIARMSSDLGVAATYATPASLVPETAAAQTAGIKTGSVAQAGKANHLELPPAVVGPLSLRLAAAKGDPSAQFEVAARLASGTGSSKDLKSAVRWYKLSAAQGFPQAQYRLGTFYERGVGLDRDLARAKIWYKRAADNGNVKAMHNLAVVTAGREDGRPDYVGAAKWFEQAAQRGLSDSQYNMAVLHESGLGVKKDLKSAYYYYALAAASGDQQAADRSNAVRAKLSPGEITAADRQIKLFQPKRTDRIANDARAAGDDWKKRADHGY